MTWLVYAGETRTDDATLTRAQHFTAARGGKPPAPRNLWTDIKLGLLLLPGGVCALWMLVTVPARDGLPLLGWALFWLAVMLGPLFLVTLFFPRSIPAQPDKWSYNRDDLKAARAGLGSLWQGRDYHLNPLYALRHRAVGVGLWLIGLGALALWGFVSGPHGMVPKFVAEMLLLFAIFLGVPALFLAWAMEELLPGHSWTLDIRDGRFHFQSASHWWPLITGKKIWSAALDDVSRVETGPGVEWEPTRPGLIGKKPTPREEMQTFLFMGDGSRRVVATVHGGRESLLTLAQSIRSTLPVLREHRDRTAGADVAIASGEGFNI